MTFHVILLQYILTFFSQLFTFTWWNYLDVSSKLQPITSAAIVWKLELRYHFFLLYNKKDGSTFSLKKKKEDSTFFIETYFYFILKNNLIKFYYNKK